MISFVVPAFNESKKINGTVTEIINACEKKKIKKFEILIIDDCSKDTTSEEIIKIKKNFLKIKILSFRNKTNLGFGGSIKKGLSLANGDKIMWIPGDNAHPSKEIQKIMILNSKKSIISTYYKNTEIRNSRRRIFTATYTPFLNFIFGLNIPYYNGLSLINKDLLSQVKLTTTAHCWQVELWVKAKYVKNFSYKFVPTILFEDDISRAFRLKNSILVVKTILELFAINIFLFLRSKFFN